MKELIESGMGLAVIQGTLMMLLLLGVRPLLRGRIPSRWIFWLWLLPLTRLLLPVVPASDLSLANLPRWISSGQETTVIAGTAPDMGGEEEVTFSSALPETVDRPEVRTKATRESASQEAEVGTGQPVRLESSRGPRPFSWETVGFGIWAAGFLGALMIHLNRTRRTRRWLKLGEAVETGRLHQCLERVRGELGLRRRVRLVTHPGTKTPFFLGGMFSQVVFPATMEETATDAELEWLFRHELNHARFRDDWVLRLYQVCGWIHWYHPLLWFTRRSFLSDCELACDEATLFPGGTAERRQYGGVLLSMAEQTAPDFPGQGALALMSKASELRLRLDALTGTVARPSRGMRAAFCCGIALTVCLGMSGASNDGVSIGQAREIMEARWSGDLMKCGVVAFAVPIDRGHELIEACENRSDDSVSFEALIDSAESGECTVLFASISSMESQTVIENDRLWTITTREVWGNEAALNIRCLGTDGTEVFGLTNSVMGGKTPRLVASAELARSEGRMQMIFFVRLQPQTKSQT